MFLHSGPDRAFRRLKRPLLGATDSTSAGVNEIEVDALVRVDLTLTTDWEWFE